MILKIQIKQCSNDKFTNRNVKEQYTSNPYDVDIGIKACQTVENAIESSESEAVLWKTFSNDEVTSTVRFIQLFSGKFQNS